MKTRPRDWRLFLLDMDGTLYLDDELFDGAKELIHHIRASGGRCLFLTNNSSRGVEGYIEKMSRLGIKTDVEDYLPSTDALILELTRNNDRRRLYAFGTESFRTQLKAAGLNVTDRLEDGIELLVVGFDTELSFRKLEDACILLGRGVDFIATNPDWVCPTWYGYVPDCGSVCEMLYRATGRRPRVIGKPQPDMALAAMEKFGYTGEQTVIVGDRVYTDIACGVNAGISSVLVLSGEATMADVGTDGVFPDYIFSGVRELLSEIQKSEKYE